MDKQTFEMFWIFYTIWNRRIRKITGMPPKGVPVTDLAHHVPPGRRDQ